MAALVLPAADGWTELFDGHSLNGWRPSENKDSWKVAEGALAADGKRSHLFYDGPFHGADFRNFELEVELMTRPVCNSGVYFHTAWQESGFPIKGFEVQVDNSYVGEGGYRERKMGGSLYGLRNIYKPFAADNRWFKLAVTVRGKNVQVRQNGMLLVDYTEPVPPVIPDGPERERFLDHGTFALQCHNDTSRALFRSVRVRPLSDDTATPGPVPVADDLFRKIIDDGRHNIPMVDYHVHIKPGLTVEQMLDRSRRDGIMYGIAINAGLKQAATTDDALHQNVDSLQGKPCFIAMQAEGREWTEMFSRAAVARFDYVFSDSMTWTDHRGKRMRLWMPDEVGTIADAEEFMDTLVDRTVGILEREPIDIYANPTYLPDQLAKDYERLWTEARRRRVIEAAVSNSVAIELNNRYKLPSASFASMAKAAGCKFGFGSNNSRPENLTRSERGIRMIDECELGWQDFFVPGQSAPRAIDRKGGVLKA
jgi:histidinol phosphatase-like PHP family hydrolase